jgi:hypothetical protein|tara:strand:- start:980 stop:1099 length:120 start_codon:yes stop_codon:yes gene_type:complete
MWLVALVQVSSLLGGGGGVLLVSVVKRELALASSLPGAA